MSNSPLVTYTRISPNRSSPRSSPIDRITIHCYVGQVTAERGCSGSRFVNYDPVGGASCNYVVGYDGSIGLCVPEGDRSWCSSSPSNDNRAVTIETASDSFAPYAVTEEAYKALLDLVTDICRRNGKRRLIWMDNKTAALAYVPKDDEMVMTVHRWFAAKACPGDWLYDRHGEIAEEVTRRLQEDEDMSYEQFKVYMDRYRQELGQQQADPWAVPYIAQAIDAGLMADVGGTIERPKDFVTRQELATSLAATVKN